MSQKKKRVKRARVCAPVETVTLPDSVFSYMNQACKETDCALHLCKGKQIDGEAILAEAGLSNAQLFDFIRKLHIELEQKEYTGELKLETDRGYKWSTGKITTTLLRVAKRLHRRRRRVYTQLLAKQ